MTYSLLNDQLEKQRLMGIYIRSRVRLRKKCRILLLLFFLSGITIVSVSLTFSSTNGETPLDACARLCPYSSNFTNRHLIFDQSHMVRHFTNFVCPQNFRNLADWIYEWPDQFKEHMEITTNQGNLIAPCLPNGSIIYVRSWNIDDFFKNIYRQLINRFVLITGEGDVSSPSHLEYLNHPESKIIHWFGQNGQIETSSTSKFTHIPIGLNCYEMADAIENIHREHSNDRIPAVFNDTDEPSSYIQPLDVSHRSLSTITPMDKLVLINMSPHTDGTGLRRKIWIEMCPRMKQKNYNFTACFRKDDGVQINRLVSIYHRNRQYPFWLSPRGNGIDCHRTWEALYLDIIPIVWNSTLNVLYENLPVLIINHHSELNETFLYSKLKEISTKKVMEKDTYAYEKLRNSYWRRMILSKSRHAEQRQDYGRKNLCWRAESVNTWKRIFLFIFGTV